jgi:undecaprenyl-diphosphatase
MSGRLMRLVTHLGGTWATVGPGIVLIVLGGPERAVGFAVLFANATSNLVVQILKRLVARPRPVNPDGSVAALVDLPDPFSFPSGHAQASTAVAATIAYAYPLLAPFAITLAGIVSASRVALRVHYASDVLAGALLGIAGAAAGAAIFL